ncbi:unnamed protein product [Parascedosporium putredinis]|uniref:Integral membrane protein n=1 Tax=Parascedosporium putredinis TaxID=1442378 RepID=A0A9P1MG49_9PEZI|nr:unnamed protein product [Parascedosporium putredinis]CAI8003767.1 unnamed protein product [Parascedosporium putredinis]
MASRGMLPLLVGMMLLTGVCNTLLTKYQDNQCARDCDNPDPSQRKNFHQPVLQTLQMFVGEMGCWVVMGIAAVYRRYISKSSAGYEALNTDERDDLDTDETDIHGAPTKSDSELKGIRVLLLSLPAICDVCGTTLMNIGLLMVAASIYQMTRGALVLFVGLFSVLFLKRRLFAFQWLSLVGVVVGVGLVGLAGIIWPDQKKIVGVSENANDVASHTFLAAIGVLLIAGAQIFTATQFVLEEYLLERSTIAPIEVVAWEGIFGFIVTLLGMIVLHFAIGRTEAGRYGSLTWWRAGGSGFNFFGISVTRGVSATARSTIDTCRTLFIWIISLGLGWETFKWLQVVGFGLLVYFTFLFNGVVKPPFKFLEVDEEVQELLPEEPIEHQ